MQRVIYIFSLALISSYLLSCAKQNSAGPSGGPKDETPPVVVESDPPAKSINFASSKIEITFDEYFVLDNLNQKLMVSPPLDKIPEVKTRGKTMIINIEEELRDSITYTMYFMDAVRDLNENNPIENFQYVFSTGDYLDSLSVTGTIYEAGSLDPGEEIFVLLHSNLSDTAVKTILPDYITRASDDGRFRIDNISPGRYAMYGLRDMNNNKLFDLPDEGFSFIDSTINISPANNFIGEMPDTLKTAADSARYLSIPGDEYRLFSFVETNKRQYLASTTRDEAFKLQYVFSQPLDTGMFSLEFINDTAVSYINEYSAKADTLVVWITDSLVYSKTSLAVLTQYPATDSTGSIVPEKDTVTFRYSERPSPRSKKPGESKGLAVNTNIARGSINPSTNLYLNFDRPLASFDKSLVGLYMLVDTNRISQDFTITEDSVRLHTYIIEHSFREDSLYLLNYDRAAFTDIFGHVNDSAGLQFKVRNKESFGTLTMRLSGYDGDLVLQIINSGGDVIRSSKLNPSIDGEVYFPLLEKGEYRAKVIFDLDGNGQWTSGDFKSKKQPEPVSFYNDIINIKVQWDLVQDWVIEETNYKSEQLRGKSGSSRR